MKPHTHEIWITLPDGKSFVAGKAWNQEQADYIRCQLDNCAKKAGWRYVYRVKEIGCNAVCRMDPSMHCAREIGHEGPHESKSYPLGPKENGGRWQF